MRTVRFTLAVGLALWIAGAGCMLGCGSVASASQLQGETTGPQHSLNISTIVSGNACATSKTHDCCAAKKANHHAGSLPKETTAKALASLEDQSPEGAMGCPLAVNRAAIVTRTNGKKIRTPAAVSPLTIPAPVSLEQTVSLTPLTCVPNRGHTYLLYCVFLI
ncbi:MAG: hypothetical protein ABJB97_01725 [Acidobacteriota bacterium]